MKAIICRQHGGPEVLQYQEIEKPSPGNSELLVQTEAIGVNYVDTMRRSGNHPTAPAPPFVPGIECCGRIAAVGMDVKDFKVGDRVIGRCVAHGAYAEFVPVEEKFAVASPEELPAEEGAAIFVTGQTAYHALVTIGKVQRDENVLITAAAGGVGTLAVQIAKLQGARVLAAAGGQAKLNLAKELGAEVLLDYSRPDWSSQVLEATGGQGANLILESVGGDVFRECLQCWAVRGRLVVYGRASGQAGVITGDELLFGHRAAYGMAVGMIIDNTQLLRSSMAQLLEWVQQEKLRVLIGHRYALQDAAEAHRCLESRNSQGKIVLLP